ncbi:Cellulose synthase [Melia azedarach]|uniref:Cellulose synthase n=1 Tax=Melia azedarach TaxID=155640 RepID=A0ACC1YGQ4_MELAZ|nr:Cellulose synthase [Melia azedarach]
MEKKNPLPLHVSHVNNLSIITNRLHAFFHCIAIAFFIYYRISFLFQETRAVPFTPWLLVFASEMILSSIWLLGRAYLWHPVSRTVFPERLPEDDKLPAIDVFICTADPEKEPTIGVMNTVLSAMALDYPPEKLHVYLSDDAGSLITLQGMREVYRFAKWWLPFCKMYQIKTICPHAYFSETENDDTNSSDSTEFFAEKNKIKEKYEMFKERVMNVVEEYRNGQDHPTLVEVIQDNSGGTKQAGCVHMPLLVYVSREKRPDHLHHFKAGALNVLLRVSGVISNAPYILGLDCDMYCNDPTSARQAMCFHLDPKISSSLAFVQFPQKFHNINKHDIYDGQFRSTYRVLWQGMDGLKGPVLSGTGYYIRRDSLYGSSTERGIDLAKLKNSFGGSNVFVKSLHPNYKHNNVNERNFSSALLQEAKILASCTYEYSTKWGEEVGLLYQSVSEDFFTGFILHCKGWTSTYLTPSRPQFLGTSTTNLNDLLIQGTRWGCGLLDVGISRFCPLLYGPSRMSFFQSMAYGELSFFPLFYCLPLWCFATVPQLCLLNGIPLYPEVSSSFFMVFSFIFLSAISKHLQEVLSTGGSIYTWRNEQRIWMMKSVTAHFYGSMDNILKRLGLRKASFVPTNKVLDNEQIKSYEMGKFDFQTSTMFLVPLVSLVILNIAAFIGGAIRTISVGNWDKMFVQLLLSFYILIINFAIVEGMVMRKDKGRIPPSAILLSTVFFMIFLFLGSVALMY